MEFVRSWYLGLNLDQLRTWRLEADEELAEVWPAIAQRASTIAECTDISVFAPKINGGGVAQPEEWFGLDLAAGEDSAEEIASSDEGEDDEGEEGEDVEPTSEAASQPQPDRASSNEARGSAPSAGGGDKAKVRQPAAPSADTTVSANQSGSSAAPPA